MKLAFIPRFPRQMCISHELKKLKNNTLELNNRNSISERG